MEKKVKPRAFNLIKHLIIAFYVLTFSTTSILNSAWAKGPIKVGIFQNKPIVYDENGPKGLFVDVLKQIAIEEDWKVKYVTCEFKDCLKLLKTNELDLMTSLGESPERAKYAAFSKEAIWTFWGTVYSRERHINSILDLKNKKIGVRKKNKITASFKTLVTQFQIPLEYVEFDNYEAAFDAMANEIIDAVAVNNTYAFTQKDINNIFYKTPIVFDPFSAYFAVSKNGGNLEILNRIDHHVKQYKSSPSSVFQIFHDKWLGLQKTYWTAKKLAVLSGLLIFMTASFMSVWRYRSLIKINQELTHSIAERKQAENDLARLNIDLKAKNEELEQVVYVASHDLRSPLVNIDGYSKELEYAIKDLCNTLSDKFSNNALTAIATILDDDIPEALKFIRTSTAKMDTLLTGLLRLSRSGRAALKIGSLDMNELVSRVVDSTEFKIKETGVEIIVEDLPPCQGDAIQIDQVFSNLLENALKCLDQNRPGVIRITGNGVGDNSVYCVEDNGIGIDVKHRDKIFEIFHQLNPVQNKGDGLGLTIVKRILGRLEGSIRIESELGTGSRFYVSLPKANK
jgi:signal transduction histidine kinase/ABC-type amino acid transport substrate-binding protein